MHRLAKEVFRMQMKSREHYVIADRARCWHRIMLSPDNSMRMRATSRRSLRQRPCHV